MRRLTYLFIMATCLASVAIRAQVVQEDELSIVYYMPQTQIEIEVSYDEEVLQRGPYYHFAEEFLGIDDVIENDATHHQITDVQIHTRTATDYDRVYKISASNPQAQLVSLTEKGLLYGYNTPYQPAAKKHSSNAKQKTCEKPQLPPPYTEEQMKTQTMRQMAESIAKQIYRIRENRMYILGGEVDNPPADGKAMELVLQELNNQELALVELFTGTRTIKHHTHTAHYVPTKSQDLPILHFSTTEGIVADDNVTGKPIVMSIEAHRQIVSASAGVQDKKAPKPSQIYYNLPGYANIQIHFGSRMLAERQITVAQMGVAIPLAQELFNGKDLPQITFDTKTGNILSISK